MTTVAADAVVADSHLFDYEVRPEWAERFLTLPDHHLGIAYVDGSPAGFVSGVEVTHPDKGPEMFLYELAVDAQFQRRGIGNALMRAWPTGLVSGAAAGCGSSPRRTTRSTSDVHLQRRQRPRCDHVMLTQGPVTAVIGAGVTDVTCLL